MRVRSGDQDALAELIRQYESDLMRVVKVRLGKALRPYLDSVDLVQSVHKSVVLGLRNEKIDIQSPQHLIRLANMIVRRKIARQWKRHRRQTRLDRNEVESCDGQSLASLILSNSKPTIDPTEGAELNERLLRVMEQLQPLEQKLIELRLEGCTTAEAARRLNVDPDVLRVRLNRTRKKLLSSGISADWF